MRASCEAEKVGKRFKPGFPLSFCFVFYRFWNYGHLGEFYHGSNNGWNYEKKTTGSGFLRFHVEILYPIDGRF